MGPEKTPLRRNPPTKALEVSAMDKIFGKHAKDVIVAFLFFTTLVALLLMEFCKIPTPERIETGFLSVLLALVGFFMGKSAK
jgi:hypothetical protein